MQHSISYPTPERPTPTEPTATVSRLRTVTGNRFPRKCACGCGLPIPRDPEIRLVLDFGGQRPDPACVREHSPDSGTYRGQPHAPENVRPLPGSWKGGWRPQVSPVFENPSEGAPFPMAR